MIQPQHETKPISTKWLDHRALVLETTYLGRSTEADALQMVRDVAPMLRDTAGVNWLVDMERAIAVRPSLEVARQMFSLFKAHLGRRIAVVLPPNIQWMMGPAMALSFAVPVKICTTRRDALEFLR